MGKILEDKRRYLYAVYVDDTNVLIRWLLQFGWFRDKWEKHCQKKVQRMTEGEVLKAYYEITGRNNYGEDDYPIRKAVGSPDGRATE